MKLKYKNKKFQPDSNILASPEECRGQWWILGEVSEAIASGPPFFTVIEEPPLFENAACSFILWYFTWFHEPQKLSKVFSK